MTGESELLFTSVHEVWPGHFLQFLWAKRAPSKLASVFGSYAFIEVPLPPKPTYLRNS